jgi:alkanesulfonate monooxygenase SsuD/methylene tetrahydromethanopterin reductase-like flavin-dependent oxidoreductase (luciferase family)
MRSALWLPLFDELADPAVVVRLAAEAEEAGWHGLFVWDHLHWRPPVREVADPWITLAAAAAVTDRLLLGPMVTPLARRRPAKVARETVTLDRLSGGRLVLGVGLGSDRFGREFSGTGDECDDRRRAAMLDEHLTVLDAAWSGEPVQHRGEHYVLDGLAFRPARRIPVWTAGFPGHTRPLRRAATRDGFFPVNLEHPDELAAAIDGLDLPDIVVARPAGTDVTAFAAAGATWWLTDFDPEKITVDEVRGVLRDGPT